MTEPTAPTPPADDGLGPWVEITVRARVRVRPGGVLEAAPPAVELPDACQALAMAAAIAPLQVAVLDLGATVARHTGAPLAMVMGNAQALTGALLREREPQKPASRLILSGSGGDDPAVTGELLRDARAGVPLRLA